MYSIVDYGDMINDTVRMAAYEKALRKVVKPGSIVVDIGTGTGIAAMLACRRGAAHVYAIEPNPAIQVARDIAKANGYSEKVTFYQEISTRVALPEQVDLIVSDMRGVLPLHGNHIPSIVDARNRFLKSGGDQIPMRDTLYIAGLDAPNLYEKILSPWSGNSFAIDMSAGKKFATNTLGKEKAEPKQILLDPVPFATLDYTTIAHSNINCGTSWVVGRAGTLYGYQIWFEALLCEGVSFSTGPFSSESIYGIQLFPLTEPLRVEQGDMVRVRIEAKLIEENYIWSWGTKVERSGNEIYRIQQNTLVSIPVAPEQLFKRSDRYAPKLNEDGEIFKFVLEQMSTDVVLGEIASILRERYPSKFSRWETALSFVGRISEKYT